MVCMTIWRCITHSMVMMIVKDSKKTLVQFRYILLVTIGPWSCKIQNTGIPGWSGHNYIGNSTINAITTHAVMAHLYL